MNGIRGLYKELRVICSAIAIVACGVAPATAANETGRTASVWMTTADGKQRLERLADLPIAAIGATGTVIRVDPSRQYQEIAGFGASITDSSAWLIRRKLAPKQRAALLRELFDRDNGLGLGLTRITIGASDFSRTQYSYDDMPLGQTDPKLRKFSLAVGGREVLPLVRQAMEINRDLRVFASPWSAPGWMKTTDSLVKGTVKPEYYAAFAQYLARYVTAVSAQGIPVFAVTIQNEPHFEPENYPGMHMNPSERADFVAGHLGPLFAKKRIGTRILDWDHNWDQPESPLAVLSRPDAARFIAGTAWHCYAGDVAVQSRVHQAFPDKETWFTECSGGGWQPDWGETLGWMTKNLIIGSTRHWAKGIILWNLALDEKSGPHLGGCGNCRGVVTINQADGEVTRNVEYYALGHASKFVRAGARRIESDTGIGGIETVAFRNPGRGTLVLIALNTSNQSQIVSIASGSDNITTPMPAGSVATFVWKSGIRQSVGG